MDTLVGVEKSFIENFQTPNPALPGPCGRNVLSKDSKKAEEKGADEIGLDTLCLV